MSYWICQCRSYICLFGLQTSFFYVFSSPLWGVGRRALNSALIALRHVTCTVTVSIAPIRRCGSINPPWCLVTQRVPSVVCFDLKIRCKYVDWGRSNKQVTRMCLLLRPDLLGSGSSKLIVSTILVCQSSFRPASHHANVQMNRWKYGWLATRVSLSGGREKHGQSEASHTEVLL